MHIETLKVFCDVVETRSFSAAASQNFVTQSAVSQQIRALETKYECKLIERTRGAVQVTPAGEIVYQASKEIVQRHLEMEGSLQSMNHRVGGTLRIATVYSVGLYELSSPLRSFLRAYPQVKVHLDYSRSNKIHEDVLRGVIDLGIVAYPSKRPYLVILPFREDRLVLICHPQHPLASSRQIPINKVHGEAAIGFERDIATRRSIDRALRSRGVALRYVAEVDNIDTIKRFVEVGQGVAIVPEPAVQSEVKSETLTAVEFSDERISRPLAIVHRKGKQFSLAAQRFVEFLTIKDALDEVGAKVEAG
ncbi:MAG: LysR family transcriptional regulator [Deltaproteobacteria bacterium]|nr:LysR family transcriptional regulator [Deltaproteobacteria bacterium]